MENYLGSFRCISSNIVNKPQLEEMGRIILPYNILDKIERIGYNQIMLFRIRNPKNGIELCCGVLDNSMNPGIVCIPNWMKEYLECQYNDMLDIALEKYLSQATNTVFLPLDPFFFTDFDDDIKINQILCIKLRDYPVLNQGTIIKANFGKKTYRIKILKTEPEKIVSSFKIDLIYDVLKIPEEMLVHSWNDPDTDSSDEEVRPEIIKHQSVNGVTDEVLPIKPIHSTFASREDDRLHGRVPAEPKKEEAAKKKNYFVGESHKPKKISKKSKGKSKASEDNTQTEVPAGKAEKKSYFVGKPRTLND
ncbi:hypothetical protein M9Y10_006536 [Tritrichomonas musculus]|uniref:Ubiquitin fusion degradation protein UFD1 N-terminal subdomain 1 domain-containing protein n=1 Tax=Tritrichomonas musculus TaxID=1915356 RepID=A0ABR2JFZ6_9EUKA